MNLATSAGSGPSHTMKQSNIHLFLKIVSPLLLIKCSPSFHSQALNRIVNTEFLCFFAPIPPHSTTSGSSLQRSPGAALGKVTSDFLLDTHISLQLLDDFSAFDGSWPHYHQILIVLAFCDSQCNFLALFYALLLPPHENIQALQGSIFSSPPILCKMRVSFFIFLNYF